MEIWKTLDRIPHYEVSNQGRVRSSLRKAGKILKPASTKDGHQLVCLVKDGQKYTSYIHRLVAEVFIPNVHPLRNYVNHIDKDPTNNNVDNLEWVSNSENCFHARNPDLYNKYRSFEHLFAIVIQMTPEQRAQWMDYGNSILAK